MNISKKVIKKFTIINFVDCIDFELFFVGTLIDIPTDYPLNELIAWKYFRELTLGIEYCLFYFFIFSFNHSY